jgi:hypothetical protein
MTDYIILDTCIFRELGFKFYENIDYINLFGFSIATESEVIMSKIVAEEFFNQFKQELHKKKDAFSSSTSALKRHPFFEFDKKIDFNIDVEIEKTLVRFKKRIVNDPKYNQAITVLPDTKISGVQLTKFILNSRNLTANVQVRDYLIWDSLLTFAKQYGRDTVSRIGRKKITHEKSRVIFITKDNGYTQNSLFQDLKAKYGVQNLEVLSSIPQYLHQRGCNLSFFNKKLIIQKFTKERILKDLDKDINALITYINPIYNDGWEMSEVISRSITNINIEEFYSHLDAKDNKYRYVVHLKVYLDILYESPDLYDPHSRAEGGYYLETYDYQKRPKFTAPVLFMYEGLLDIKKESIKSVKMIDFLPWVYIYPKS